MFRAAVNLVLIPALMIGAAGAHAAAAGDPPTLSRLSPIGYTAYATPPAWNSEISELLRRYPGPNLARQLEQLSRAKTAATRDNPAQRSSGKRSIERIEKEIRLDCLRTLVAQGLSIPAVNGVTPERTQALKTIAALSQPVELFDAARILEGEGFRKNLIASEPDVARAYFAALATDPILGQTKLVQYGVTGSDEVSLLARETLPRELSPNAINLLRASLAGQRERDINRAAMIAGTHPAGALIPSLIQAQFEQTSAPPEGDEAWIAIGKSTTYIAGLVPVVGNGSGAFQPIPGVVFEGSILRIMESAVTIYRTEVHQALVATVEQTTGQPAPPFGLDRDRWMAWYRNEYPQLASAYRREAVEKALADDVRSSPARADN